MVEALSLQQFITAAQQAYDAPRKQSLSVGHNDHIVLGPVGPARSLQVQEKNRQTWDLFLRSVSHELGPVKVQEICKRYRFDVVKMYRQGAPLLPKHIEIFSVGASRIATKDLKRQFDQSHLRDLSVEQLSERLHTVNPFPIVGWSIDPRQISGDPTHTSSYFIYDPFWMDKETQLLFSDVGDLSFPAWQERLCKAVLNRELFEKQIIPAPGVNGRTEYYKVYRKIATGDGLVAYALSPLGSDSTLKPLLVFRPTQGCLCNEDGLETYLNDVEHQIGKTGYLSAKGLLDQLIEDPKFCPVGTRIKGAGYSLGGTHFQRFLADHWHSVSEASFYNDPSVESELAEEFAQEINHAGSETELPHLTIFRVAGDLADCIGEKHLGWGITRPGVVQLSEYDPRNKKLSKPELHGIRVFDTSRHDYHILPLSDPDELNTYLDNEQRGSKVFRYEKMRKYCGGVAYNFLCAFRGFLEFLSTLLGIPILKRNQATQ